MNKIKTLKALTKLAGQLDNIGRQAEANFIDQMISKLAQEASLTPIGQPYKDGDKWFQKFDAGAKGLVVKEVNPDGSLKGAPAPTDTLKDTPTTPSDDSWEAWFRKNFPGLLPALDSKPEEAIEEQRQNKAKDKPTDKVEDLLNQIRERYKKLKNLGWSPPLTKEETDPTQIMEWEDPDDLPTRMDIIDNIDFDNMPDFKGEEDWADVSMWQDGKPLDNRF